ncbi:MULTISPECIES: collagen binding domain-containing protein [unclassified Oscillibacter]|uniref:MSCRAMM family protein n=1 Tax=unclassified Oscillibacter TaxID=2629304 RepID=UPI0003AE24D0|nr:MULTISPECIES: SpaA isopeptide-forming pilin-related protein [unclassified Oscillibacter]ERK59968.1 Cna protein B-type domain protein [Oscillibacter sp. KLE 1728]ERK62667.1 Cna protein B-type domain protein [Oscillibacter sp. KLE 1745]
MKKRIVTLLLTLLTVLTLLPTAAMAAESTGVGITPVTDPNLWTTRLNSQGQSYSYRPPTAAGRQLWCMDLGYSYRYGTESFLQSYTYRSATGADADALWNDAVAETGLGEMDAITRENVKWMMSYIADYTGEIPGSLFMALQTYIWDNQSDKSAGGDPSGDIDAGGFANADTYDQYVEYYNWLLGQKANEDAELQAQVEEYAAQGIRASIVEDESSKWVVLATSSVSGRQTFFAYHSDRKVITSGEPGEDPEEPSLPAGDGDITFQKVIAGTDRGLDGAVYNIYLDGQIAGSDVTSGGGYIEVHDVTEGLWSFVEQEAPSGYALDPTPRSVYVSVTDGDKQYTVTAEDEELPGIKVIKTSAADGSPVENAVYSIKGVTCAFSTSVSTGPDGCALVEDLPAGVYVVKEESVPEPFVRTASEQTIALRPGKISEARFEDYTRPGLEIVKRNIADGSPIEGVTYQVRQIDGDFQDTVVTDSEGRAFLEVDPGSYEISEVNVPSNVIISEIPQTISLEAGVTRTVRFFNAVKPSLTVIKRNSITQDPLENARFHIYYASDNTTTGEINDLGTYYTDSSGRITLTDINRGWYKVVEEESPTGFSIQDDGVYEFYLEAGASKELVVDNTPLSALVVYKYDSRTGALLEGARFELRYLSGETSGTGGTVIGEYETSKNGSFTVTGLKEGTYIVQELESPDGHLIDSEPQTVYISGKEQDVVTLRFGNAPLGSLLITKVSDDEKREPLSDVEFLLTDSSGNFIGTNNGRYVTNSAGEILVEGLTPGTTVVAREVRAKPGYLLDDSPRYALIRSGETVGLEFRNAPAGNLVIVKRSSSGTHEPLEGVEFKITYADGAYVPDENGQLSSNGLYYTDREGKITISGVVGTIVATETASIPGYTIDEATRTQTVVVHPNDTQTLYFYNKPETTLVLEKFIKGTDREPLAGVEFLVTDGAGTVIGPNNGVYTTGEDGRAVITGLTPGTTITARETQTAEGFVLDGSPQSILIKEGEVQTLTFWNAREGGVEIIKVNAADKTERLPDAVFEIHKASDDALVDTVTTRDTGTVFAPLAEGDYYALEQESPSGFKLDSTRHYFSVKNGEVTQEVIENEAVSGILVHKISTADGEGIPGVSFILYDSGHNPIDQQTTDDRGYAWFEDLEGGGRFYLRELENEGYIPDTQLRTVYVKAGETTLVEWENTPITGQIQIVKRSADYNPTNGLPAGTLLEGAVFEIYDKAGNLVDTIKSNSRGLAVSKQLPLSLYSVREVKAPANYGINEEVLTAYLEYEGQILRFEVTDKSLSTGVSITKTGPKEVVSGQPVNYTFSGIANTSNVRLGSFYWRDTLPAQVRLDTVVTGTYNFPGAYKITYRVNGGEYRTLADNLSTAQNYTLAASPAALGLAANERVTEIMFVFGQAPGGFAQVEKPMLKCTAVSGLTAGSSFVNIADVGGVYNDQWVQAISRWVTTVYGKTETLPRTGY